MDIRPFLCGFLLLSTGMAEPVFAADPTVLKGQVYLTVIPEVSSMPVDFPRMAEQLCLGHVPWILVGPCKLTIPSSTIGDPIGPGPILSVPDQIPLLSGRTQEVPWEVTSFAGLTGAPVESLCGSWEVRLELDSARPAPVSSATLQPSKADPMQGVFASLLELPAVLRLTHASTGRTAEWPLDLAIPLAGPWILAPAAKGADSNLLLLTDQGEQGPVAYTSTSQVRIRAADPGKAENKDQIHPLINCPFFLGPGGTQ